MEIFLAAGYLGIFLTVFIQLSLPIGIFLPGTSFLLATGLLAAQGQMNIAVLIIVTSLGSILGDSCGYFLGNKFGHRFLSGRNIAKAQSFYEKYGSIAVIFSRFVHFVRTFIPALAGAGRMPYFLFLTYSFLGALLWTAVVPLLGYLFGAAFPSEYLRYLIFALIVLAVIALVRKIKKTV